MKQIEIIDNKAHCIKCDEYKDISEFYFHNNKPKRPCKLCKIKYQKSVIKNNFSIQEYKKNYYQKNKKSILISQFKRDQNRKEEIRIYQINYRNNNKDILRKKKKIYSKNKIQNKPFLKLRLYVSNAIFQALKYNNSTKNNSCIKYLPYSLENLKQHLEKQFEPWMTWSNWGNYRRNIWNDNDSATWTWHIDHIISQSKLPYYSMEDDNFKKCWSLENLRPYSAKQNVIDGAR